MYVFYNLKNFYRHKIKYPKVEQKRKTMNSKYLDINNYLVILKKIKY